MQHFSRKQKKHLHSRRSEIGGGCLEKKLILSSHLQQKGNKHYQVHNSERLSHSNVYLSHPLLSPQESPPFFFLHLTPPDIFSSIPLDFFSSLLFSRTFLLLSQLLFDSLTSGLCLLVLYARDNEFHSRQVAVGLNVPGPCYQLHYKAPVIRRNFDISQILMEVMAQSRRRS